MRPFNSADEVREFGRVGKVSVLFVLSGVEKYGVRRGTLAFAAGLREAGIATQFAAITSGPVADEVSRQGHRIDILCDHALPGLTGGFLHGTVQLTRQAYRGWLLSSALKRLLLTSKPSALYFRLPNLVAPVGIACRPCGIPAYWHIPNAIGDRYPLQLNKRLYWSVLDRCPVVSMANSAFTARTLDRGSDDIHVLHVGTDERLFDPSAVTAPVTRDELSIPPSAAVFGIFARLVENKGQLQFLRGLVQVSQSLRQQIHLLLLGGPLDTPYAAEVRAFAKAHDTHVRAHLLGSVSDPERYYSVVDVAVNSRLDAEPYGQSIVEGMMMGKPVLAHALGGPTETVVNGKTGWLTPASGTGDFAEGVARALADRSEWTVMGQQARAHALKHFSLSAQVQRFLRIAPHLRSA